MSFELDVRERDGVTILAPKGRLVMGEPVSLFRSRLESLIAAGQIRIVLDMREVDYIDSSALGLLVMQHTQIEKLGGAMPLFGLSRRSVELMVITKLVTVFRIAEDELEAVNSCFPDREHKSFDILEFVEEQDGPLGEEA